MDIVACGTCGLPCEVTDRFVLESTSGPVEHIRARCTFCGSPFLGPASAIVHLED